VPVSYAPVTYMCLYPMPLLPTCTCILCPCYLHVPVSYAPVTYMWSYLEVPGNPSGHMMVQAVLSGQLNVNNNKNYNYNYTNIVFNQT
jgi:hypothetical protein